jgi:hypothetical protein
MPHSHLGHSGEQKIPPTRRKLNPVFPVVHPVAQSLDDLDNPSPQTAVTVKQRTNPRKSITTIGELLIAKKGMPIITVLMAVMP